jgi:hypothetical protein
LILDKDQRLRLEISLEGREDEVRKSVYLNSNPGSSHDLKKLAIGASGAGSAAAESPSLEAEHKLLQGSMEHKSWGVPLEWSASSAAAGTAGTRNSVISVASTLHSVSNPTLQQQQQQPSQLQISHAASVVAGTYLPPVYGYAGAPMGSMGGSYWGGMYAPFAAVPPAVHLHKQGDANPDDVKKDGRENETPVSMVTDGTATTDSNHGRTPTPVSNEPSQDSNAKLDIEEGPEGFLTSKPTSASTNPNNNNNNNNNNNPFQDPFSHPSEILVSMRHHQHQAASQPAPYYYYHAPNHPVSSGGGGGGGVAEYYGHPSAAGYPYPYRYDPNVQQAFQAPYTPASPVSGSEPGNNNVNEDIQYADPRVAMQASVNGGGGGKAGLGNWNERYERVYRKSLGRVLEEREERDAEGEKGGKEEEGEGGVAGASGITKE